uniref:Uncharacterized protein n=1 Tax=Chromera velia CCMP2878 TaxID=1169474 RepID=A0A0G4FIF2_9ALVE|eukprot:Cvel_17174.t1-p1 / transcript=Cvel_17174.t1 / gene=Cvel_17174 / organism=Chromera_velia_CCMP2878 / gene_product=hypothetical protein / transcript_product=hypothetical protein / location=Cvel_scaffold1357:10676-11971(-) / protein_length=350 / sequence_SO=supercontig / SO=protein_coding / is_pseudo=false
MKRRWERGPPSSRGSGGTGPPDSTPLSTIRDLRTVCNVGKGLQALVERCICSNREGVAFLMSDPNHRFPLTVIHLMAMEERWGYSCAFHRTVGGIPFTLTFRRAPPGWRVGDTAVVSIPSLGMELCGEGDTGARYRRRAGRSDLDHRGFPLVLPGTSSVGRYEGLQRETQWPARKFSFQLADEGEGVVGLREASRLTHLREGYQEISSMEAQASASSSSSSALPSALPPSFPPPAPVEPSDPSPAQAEASVREAGAAGARARSPSPVVSNRASVDSGESPLPDFFVPLGSSMKGTILDPSGPGVLHTPGTVRKHTRAPSRGRRVKDSGPVFCDKKGNRLLGADGEPLGYN